MAYMHGIHAWHTTEGMPYVLYILNHINVCIDSGSGLKRGRKDIRLGKALEAAVL